MRMIVFGDDDRKRAREIIEYSKANVYRPGDGVKPPGMIDEHWMIVPFWIRIVFSITEMPNKKRYRHLTFSILNRNDALPNPGIIETIAREMFEFTGKKSEWEVGVPDNEPQVVSVAQELKT